MPCDPNPILQVHASARLCIVGQAPGRKAHETSVPWNDPSGVRLRDWLGLTPEQFYDRRKVAIMPMSFCYPGKGRAGDHPPRRECAPKWHLKLKEELTGVRLTLLIGQYAQAYYLADLRKETMRETVRAWKEYLPTGYIPLPHPSPRNQPWLKQNPWFETELLGELRKIVATLQI